MPSRNLKLTAAGVFLAVLGIASAPLATPSVRAEQTNRPVVVELFTSQSCYSCPAAEAFLAELVEQRDDVIALEWHVDYWDKLVYRGSAWKDVFSDPAFTERQRVYAAQMPRGQSYTPQMVIGGTREAVGSRRGDVLDAIRAVRGTPPLSVDAARRPDGRIAIDIAGEFPEAASVWLVTILKSRTTDVQGGENGGKKLANHNVVRAVSRVGTWTGTPVSLSAPVDLDADHDCVVLVQDDGQGPILGAAACGASDDVRS